MIIVFGLISAILFITLISLLLSIHHLAKQIEAMTEDKDTSATLDVHHPLLKKLAGRIQNFNDNHKMYYHRQQEKGREIHHVLQKMNHYLKTPLSVATGYTEVLYSIEQNSEQKEMLKKVDQNLTIIGQYLDYQTEYNLILEKKFNQQKKLSIFPIY